MEDLLGMLILHHIKAIQYDERPLHIKANGNQISVGFLEGSTRQLVIDVYILVIVAIFLQYTNLCWKTLTLQQNANLFLN